MLPPLAQSGALLREVFIDVDDRFLHPDYFPVTDSLPELARWLFLALADCAPRARAEQGHRAFWFALACHARCTRMLKKRAARAEDKKALLGPPPPPPEAPPCRRL